MEKTNAKELLAKYEAGTCTEQEKALLESWHLGYAFEEQEKLSFVEQTADLDSVWNRLQSGQQTKTTRIWPFMVSAAAILLIAGIGVFFYQFKNEEAKAFAAAAASLQPGKNNAVLTLADGKKIVLDDAANGEIARQSGISIKKSADGTIVYEIADSKDKSSAAHTYNTVGTPRGGKYQLNLPDGSRVWLNSASEISFPVVFAANERRVTLKGEAYFEVAKNARQPFHVVTASQEIAVLGTHFNVNAFGDEPASRTTLLEGSVKVSTDKASGPVKEVTLKPGQQAVMSNNLSIANVNAEEAVSWKNGMFQFNETELSSIMRQAARWYDVDVVYEGKVPPVRFSGEVSRNVNAATFLDMLKFLDVKFRIEKLGGGRSTIIVSQ